MLCVEKRMRVISNRYAIRLSLLAVAAIGIAPCTLASVIDYWRFEDGGGTFVTDQTGLANGTANSTTNWSSNVPGAVVPQTGQSNDTSLHFSLGNNVVINPTSELNYGSNLTVECYFNLDKLPSVVDHFAFVYLLDSTNGMFPRLELDLTQTAGAPQFQAILNGATGGTSIYGSNPLTLSAATWFHMAFVKNGSSYQFFLDGNSVGEGLLNSEQAGSYEFSTGGNYRIGGLLAFNGYIDEVRMSNVALVPSQFLNAVPEPSTFALMTVAGVLVCIFKFFST
jgi:hypothetical protein